MLIVRVQLHVPTQKDGSPQCFIHLLSYVSFRFIMTRTNSLVVSSWNLIKVESTYLKVFTSKSLSTFSVKLVTVFWLLLWTRILLVARLISVFYDPDTFFTLVMNSFCSASLLSSRTISSANLRLETRRTFEETKEWIPWSVFWMLISKKMLKNTVKRKNLLWIPLSSSRILWCCSRELHCFRFHTVLELCRCGCCCCWRCTSLSPATTHRTEHI